MKNKQGVMSHNTRLDVDRTHGRSSPDATIKVVKVPYWKPEGSKGVWAYTGGGVSHTIVASKR